MKITYTPNPLNTIVELDDHELEVFRLKLKLKEYEDLLFSAHFHLQEDESWFDINRARKELDPVYWCTDDKSKLEERVDELLEHYVEELAGSHIGDCTCFAASCSKCNAESILGIDTIKGLGKHPGHKIQSVFNYKDGDIWKERTMDEALELLRVYDPKPTGPGWEKVGGYEQYVPRWTQEAKHAYEWLLDYKTTKLVSVDIK